MANAESINLHVSCHCRTFALTLTLPRTAFPLKSSLCHCSICRHATGHIFASFAVVPLPEKPSCIGLTSFDSSPQLTRWFCATCGCSVWNDDRGNNEWELATGVISGVSYDDLDKACNDPRAISRGPGSPEGPGDLQGLDGILDRVQMWIESTGDGGGAIWLNGGRLHTTQRKFQDRHSRTVNDVDLDQMAASARTKLTSTPASNDSRMTATCGCGLVKVHITRPSPSTRYEAGIDACWSCRKTSGFEITSWATVPVSHFSWAESGKPITLDEDVFTRYSTSPGVMRYFCHGCGVMLFWVKEGRDTWDIGVGLLAIEGEQEETGVRLEGWLDWVKYGDRLVAYVEDAVDVGLVAGLVDGVRRDKRVF